MRTKPISASFYEEKLCEKKQRKPISAFLLEQMGSGAVQLSGRLERFVSASLRRGYMGTEGGTIGDYPNGTPGGERQSETKPIR